MKLFQSSSFARRVKKITQRDRALLDAEIRKIAAQPSLGQEKKGDLKGVLVHKFKLGKVEYLLAYRIKGADLELIMIGPHENYYRDLKNYLQDQ